MNDVPLDKTTQRWDAQQHRRKIGKQQNFVSTQSELPCETETIMERGRGRLKAAPDRRTGLVDLCPLTDAEPIDHHRQSGSQTPTNQREKGQNDSSLFCVPLKRDLPETECQIDVSRPMPDITNSGAAPPDLKTRWGLLGC